MQLPVTLFKREKAPAGEQIIAAEYANALVTMLEGVVSEGTASGARVPGYRIAGKTGTVRKLINGSYGAGRYLAMFAGIAPVEDPRIVTVVVVDDPRSGVYYGGLVAAPVFASIMQAVLPMLNIEPKAFVAELFSLLRKGNRVSNSFCFGALVGNGGQV